jgi:myo-inositol 2-dehydrogenase / D-chiro-inositol 1-dehydrogenase
VHADTITFRLRNATLAGVQSGSRELAERCSLEHGCKPYYEYEKLLEDPEVDAVCICSASNRHTEQIIASAQAGKHIFCEKPIDLSLEAIDKALLAVKKAGVKLQVGFNRRFDTNYARVRRAIVSDEIGMPHMLHITSRDPSPPSLDYVKTSGGIWLDCSIHDLDMSRFLIGDEVEEVYALGAVNITPGIEKYGDVDTSIITLRFKNGVIGTIDNSRQAVYGYDQRCEVLGSKGSISINNNYNNSAVISNNEAVFRDLPMHFFMDRYTDSFITELDEFCKAILHDNPIPCTGLDGRAPVVIALAAKKSYKEGRPVKTSEVDIPLPAELSNWDGQ